MRVKATVSFVTNRDTPASAPSGAGISAGKVTLIGYPRGASPFDFSPFVAKLETYLQLAQIPYQVRAGDPRKSRKAKLPALIDSDGTRIVDSQHIIEHLQRTRGDTLDAGLDAATHARLHAVRRLFEESLYWVLVHARWMDEPTWQKVRVHLFGTLPVPLKFIVPNVVRRKVRTQLHAQGYGRHTREELERIARDDLDAIVAALGDASFFGGDRPRSIDATAYGFLVNLVHPPFDTWLGVMTRAQPKLVAYVGRMEKVLKR
jgi:glutathione S-transferase